MCLLFGLHPVKLVLAFNILPVISASISIIGNVKTKQGWKHTQTHTGYVRVCSSSALGRSTSFSGKFHSLLREGEPRSNLVV